jgi:hypothetical protein
MTSPSKPSTTSSTPNWPLSPLSVFESLLQLAPYKLNQPINQGWTFGNLITVTEQNSTSPDTERSIVAAHSYGRQLGRVIDAMAQLIKDLPESQRQNEAFKQFADLRNEIEQIKSDSAARRLDHFAEDLAELRKTDGRQYQRVARELRAILDR